MAINTPAPIQYVNLAGSSFKADPFPFYARLRAEAPVYRTTITIPNKRPVWLITRYQDVVAVLKDEHFAKDRNNALPLDQIRKASWMPGIFKAMEKKHA